MESHKLNLFKNSFFNSLAYTLSSLLWFFLIPFVIRHLGEATYGIWAIASLVLSLTNLANLGLPSALTLSSAEALNAGKSSLLRWLIRAADAIFALLSLLLLLITLLFGHFIGVKIFGITDIGQLHSLRILLPLMCLVTLFFMLSLSRKAVIDGFQEVFRSSQVTMLGRFLNFIVTIITILLGWGIWSLYAGSLIEYAVDALLYHWIVHIHLNRLEPIPPSENIHAWASLKTAMGYGIKLQISSIFGMSMELFYKSFISNQLGLAALGQFQVVWRLIQIIQGFLVSTLRPIFSASAYLVVKNDWNHLLRLFNKTFQYALLLSITVISILIPFASLIFRLWLGQSPNFQVIIFQALCVWVAISTIATPGFMYLMGAGYSGLIIFIQCATSFTSIGLAILPSLWMSDYPWVMIGISYAIGGLVSLVSTQTFVKSRFKWSFRDSWRVTNGNRILVSGVILAIFAGIAALVSKSILINLLAFIMLGGFYLLVFYKLMPREDHRKLLDIINRVRKAGVTHVASIKS